MQLFGYFIPAMPTVIFTFSHSCVLPRNVCLWSPTVELSCFLSPARIKLSSVSLLCPVGFGVSRDCAVLTLVTAWCYVFDCGSFEWISEDKALVPVRGSCSGPCLLSHFPDKPNCIS